MAQQHVSIKPEYTAQPLEQILADTGSELLLATLQKLPVAAKPQPAEGATYANKLTSKDRIADWQGSAKAVHQQVRALSDRMPVRCAINGAVMQILASRVVSQNGPEATKPKPGTLLKASKDGLYVQCGQDELVITRLKLNRGKGQAMDAAAALNGYPDILHSGAQIDAIIEP